jgi:phosphohistidine phosphatase SixA
MKRLLLSISLALCLGACCTTAPRTHDAPPPAAPAAFRSPLQIPAREIIIVRHADRDKDHDTHAKHTGSSDYDSLTPAGWMRVQALAAALQNQHVTRIITTTTLRTQQTAFAVEEDLAKSGQTPFLDFATLTHASAPAAIVGRLEAAKPGDVVLLICHHEYVPGIIEALGGPTVPDINDAEYDRLYTLTRSPADPSRWTLTEKSFGTPYTH